MNDPETAVVVTEVSQSTTTEASPTPETPVAEEPTKEVPTEEPAKEPKAEEPKPTDKLSLKIAKVAEREAQAEQKEKEIQAREAQIAERESFLKTVKETPTKALEALGISLQELLEAVVSEGEPKKPDPVEELKSKVQKLEEEREEEKKASEKAKEESEQAYIDEAINTYKTNLNTYLDSNADKYELITLNDKRDLVWEVVEQNWQNEQKILDIEEACDLVETYLEKQIEKLAASKKLQAKIAPKESDKRESKTLTNAGTAHQGVTVQPSGPMSREERLRRAAALLRYN